MNRSFDYLIKPILEEYDFKHIVEVGSQNGYNTEKIVKICKQKNANLSVIDPFPNFNVFKMQREVGEFEFYQGLSLDELPKIKNYDVVLLDGDHNYYTLKSELELINKSCEKFPIIFFHDVAWPYARRDMYYNPDNIAVEHINEYKKMGMRPGNDGLVEGGLNAHLCNAKNAYTEKNGVLTAIEDFIKENDKTLLFNKVEYMNGIGVLCSKENQIVIEKFEKLANSKVLVENLEKEIATVKSELAISKHRFEKLTIETNELNEEYLQTKTYLENQVAGLNSELEKITLYLTEQNNKLTKQNNEIKQKATQENKLNLQKLNEKDQKIKDLNNKNSEKDKLLSGNNKLIKELNTDIANDKNKVALARIYEHTRKNLGLKDSDSIKNFSKIFTLLIFYLKLVIRGKKKDIIQTRKHMNLLKNSEYFDVSMYLLNNPDVYYSRVNPYIHYLYFGGFEGRNPSTKFNSEFYLEEYNDVKKEGINPLLHYLKYGKNEDRVPCLKEVNVVKKTFVQKVKISEYFEDYNFDLSYDNENLVDVIVPVHNAYDDVLQCLDSLLARRTLKFNLIIVNDGSGEETTVLLERFKEKFNCKYIRNEKALGYTFAINMGLRVSESKYKILLNSDTIVTTGWLENMLDVFIKHPNTGIVGPLSNAASFQTVPEIMENGDWKVCTLPEGISLELFVTIIKNNSKCIYPQATFLNGFCFMISRDVIDTIGLFDEEIFGSGYGEENDFCLRATENNFELRIADNTYIFHEKSKSFSHETRKVLSSEASRKLNDKHGAEVVSKNLNAMKNNQYLHDIRANIVKWTEDFKQKNLLADKAIFYYLPTKSASGGVNSVLQEVEELRKMGYNANIINRTANYTEYFEIFPQAKEFTYFVKNTVEFIALMRQVDILISTVNSGTPLTNLMRMIYPNKTYLYYVQDYEPLFYNKKQPAYEVAFNSYKLFCEKEMFAKTEWINEQLVENHGKHITKVKPSIDTKIYNGYEPVNRESDELVIVTMLRFSTQRRNPLKTLKILNLLSQKLDIKVLIFGCTDEELAEHDIEFEYENYGVVAKEVVPNIFKRSTIFLDYSEFQAFGRTGLEAMSLGVIPILPKAGGISEYAVDGENCLVVDTEDALQKNADKIIEFISDKELLSKVLVNALDTAKRYDVNSAIYSISECMNWNLQEKEQNSLCTILTDGNANGVFNATGYIRIILPITKYATSINRKVSVLNSKSHRITDIKRLVLMSEKVVIQREFNVSMEHAKELVDLIKSNNIEIIYEIDDNLLYFKHHKGDLVKFYMSAADKVVVSTEKLAELVGKYNDNVIIIKNKPYAELYEKEEKSNKNSKVKYIGYFGTPSHKADLEMLQQPIKNLRRELKTKHNMDLVFEVIGVTSDKSDWYDIREINKDAISYPIFSLELSRIAKNWDIGIIVGEENEFTQNKSDLKYFEYTLMNVISCSSNIHPYNKVIEDGVNGYLVENTNWYEKLLKILLESNSNKILENANKTYLNITNMDEEWGNLF